MKILKTLLLLIVVTVSACEMPKQAPVFKNVTQVKTKKVSGANLNLTANAIFYNPNDMGLKLKGVEIDVLLEGKKVGHISQREKIKIPSKGDFAVPLNVDLDLKQSGMISGIFGMLSGKKMEAEFIGYVRISKNAVAMKVPVKFTEKIKLNL